MSCCCTALKRVDAPDTTSDDGIVPEQWAYAWEAGKTLDQMARVVWDVDQNAWFKWDSTQNNYATENGHRQKWGLLDGHYQFFPL